MFGADMVVYLKQCSRLRNGTERVNPIQFSENSFSVHYNGAGGHEKYWVGLFWFIEHLTPPSQFAI